MTPARPLRWRAARLVALLSDGTPRTQADVAAELGCTDRHVRRLLADAAVSEALGSAARESLRAASVAAGLASTRMIQHMVSVADDVKALPASRLAAAVAVLTAARELVDLHELSDKVRAFEAASRSGVPRYS